MILSDREILSAMRAGQIVIDPFRRERLGTNSYDVSLGYRIGCYSRSYQFGVKRETLDARADNPFEEFIIPDEGIVLHPGTLYLAATLEYTETRGFVPFLDGKSSVGRLGIFIHATAGRGDSGFCNHWTMELSVVEPVRVYATMPIGQIIYFGTSTPEVSYDRKPSAKYNGRNPGPAPSQMWKNYDAENGRWK